MTTALVVDDEPAICQCFETLLETLNCDVHVAASAEDGLQLAEQQSFDVIILDVRLPGMDGLTALEKLKAITDAPIIIMTAHGDLSTAVAAVENGAFEYLPKPFELDQVTDVLVRAIQDAATRAKPLPEEPHDGRDKPELVGGSLAMQHLFRQTAMAAQHNAPVLITGESGTGKELVARAIHRYSSRSQNALVPVNLASLSDGLMERELFGHTAGAFTGADQDRPGVIAQANGGTLFLDEIGETPKHFQVKLLRTMETGEFQPVGAPTVSHSDFRIIAATNVSLDSLRSSEHFRQDFFFRLATIHIRVPPLRERLSDVPELAAHFLTQHCGDSSRRFADDAIAFLQQQDYPGNVRELRNAVVRAASESTERVIGLSAVMAAIDATLHSAATAPASADSTAGKTPEFRSSVQAWAKHALSSKAPAPLQNTIEIVEGEFIRAALELTRGNRSEASRMLGIHRETLRDKLQKLDDETE